MNNRAGQSDAQIISRLFFHMLPAQVFMLALNGINNMIDGLVGSNFVGAKAMSAIGIYTPLQMCCMAVSVVLMSSSQVLCGRYMGEGRMDKTQGVYSLTLTIGFVFTALVAIASFIVPGVLAGVLGATAENQTDVIHYIIGRGVGVIPLLMGQQFASFLQLERQSTRNYIATGLMFVVNAGLDLLFAAVLRMGAMGLGLATSLSNWVYMIVVGSFFLTRKATLKYKPREMRGREVWKMVSIGFPSALLVFLSAFRNAIFNRQLAAHASVEAVAAFATFNMVYTLFTAVASGMAATGRMLVSVSYGEEDQRSIVLLLRTILTKGLALIAAIAVLEYLFSSVFAGLYYSDRTSAVYAMTLTGLRWGCLYLFLDLVVNVFTNYYQAVGRIGIVNVLSALQGLVVPVPLCMLLVPRMRMDGLWITLLIGGVVAGLVMLVYAAIYWKRWPRTLAEWFTIPADFGAAKDERLDITIHSMDDVNDTARKIYAFCKGRGIEHKRAYYSALCLEEMAVNIVKHGFNADRKSRAVDVRVIHKGDDVILRIKDDCIPFNPKERAELIDSEDVMHNIGIRMVAGSAKTMDYQNLLGLNVLTIRV